MKGLDFADVRGNTHAIDAVRAAVRDMRVLALAGAPGCGKTMLAARIPSIMGPMDKTEIAQVIARMGEARLWPDDANIDAAARPFRAPHHTISAKGLVGEARLARCGVLFLDDVDQFGREALLSLADEMARAPAWCRPLLVIAYNPGANVLGAMRALKPLPRLVTVDLQRVTPSETVPTWPPSADFWRDEAPRE